MAASIILYLMQEEVKLVVAQEIEGEEQEYFIFKNIKLGEGGFGVVKKAIAAKDKSQELAVKIVPYGGDAVKRKKIEKQINIIKLLPNHPNLVRVLPVKCFSENNFYIFMEYCKDGTLHDLLREQGLLEQSKIFDIFWQLLSGYRVLWQHGILHQDMKLANVLIKKGVLKITDFGFSILTEQYVPSLIRQGTLQYMPLQKLTDGSYIADEMSDVYSMGVMMYEIMTKLHPYINQKGLKSQKQYVAALKNATLLRPRMINTYSAALQGLFDLVARMVSKNPKNRVNCQEIYDYIDNDEVFAAYRSKNIEKTQEIMLNLPPMTIVDKTSVFSVPFGIGNEKEEEYIEKIKIDKDVKRNEENHKTITKIESWALSLRLIVCYFDRLARRLFVQKLRGKFYSEKTHSFNRTILACLLAEAKLTRWILKQLRYPQTFSKQEIDLFRPSEQGKRTLSIVRRDEEYIRDEITDNLKRTTQQEVKDLKKLMQLSEKQQFSEFVATVIPYFSDCIFQKATFISNKKDLVTIMYLIDSIELMKPLPIASKQLQLEEYFYQTETRRKQEIFHEVQSYLTTNNIDSNIDDDIYMSDDFLQQ